MQHTGLQRLVTVTIVLALMVIIVGAYTRLTDAGLGCPDWPGCYGQMFLKSGVAESPEKAWTEMIHRYLAGSLGLLVGFIALRLIFAQMRIQGVRTLAGLLIALVFFQAALGMWTVTWQLLPIVVMGHLLGGLTLVSMLWWLRIRLLTLSGNVEDQLFKVRAGVRRACTLGFCLLFAQIALGGWVSANYAGLACIGFPACNGLLWPDMNMQEAFSLMPLGYNYQGGVLSSSARVTVQMIHRLGAVSITLYLLFVLSWVYYVVALPRVRCLIGLLLGLLAVQWSLGIINVTKLLPLPVAVGHNAIAALLLLTMLSLVYILHYQTHDGMTNGSLFCR